MNKFQSEQFSRQSRGFINRGNDRAGMNPRRYNRYPSMIFLRMIKVINDNLDNSQRRNYGGGRG